MASEPSAEGIRIDHHLAEPTDQEVRRELREHLGRTPPALPSRYFYDDHGSTLFEAITELPEYYQTRTEAALLRRIAADVVARTGARELVELGSGAATKSRILLDAMRDAGQLDVYVPVEVSEGILRRTAQELRAEYPGLRVHGLVADFVRDLGEIPEGGAARLVAFLGGTIGNLDPDTTALSLLRHLHDAMSPRDRLLMGSDWIKDPAVIERAYNDAQGVTAEFNLNILRVMNRRFDADFDPDAFSHRAFFEPENRWIEMRLAARRPQRVHFRHVDQTLELDAGDEILTEISTKYDRERLETLYAQTGFELEALYLDDDAYFALSLARPV